MKEKLFSFDNGLSTKQVYDGLTKKEQETIDKFKDYMLISASLMRATEGIREVLRFKAVTKKDLNKIDLEDLRYFLKELKEVDFSDHTKNKVKTFVQRFLRWNFKDWSERFNEFYDIKVNTDAQNKKPITSKTLFTEVDISKLLEAEHSLYWKTFLITQSEGALRTGETRFLTWDMIDFEDDGFTILNIPSKKNRNATIKIKPVVVKIAGNFLKELKQQQEKYGIKTKYVFPSPQNPNKPISKMVNLWFNKLCKKVLGREGNNYLLRHSKGTELQERVRKGQLTKDNAVDFMRHSEKMFDKVYSHMDKEDIKQLIKKQIYNTKDLTSQERDEIKNLRDEITILNQKIINQESEITKKIEKIILEKIAKMDVNKFMKDVEITKKV